MARSRATQGDDGVERVYGLVSDTLSAALLHTIELKDPEAARHAVSKIVAVDDEVTADEEPPPGWSLAFLVLADWFDVARTELADHPDRADRALDWIEENLGRRYRSRARYTIGPLTSVEEGRDTSHYIDALGDDFLASMVWAAAAVTALYPDESCGHEWLRRHAEAAR